MRHFSMMGVGHFVSQHSRNPMILSLLFGTALYAMMSAYDAHSETLPPGSAGQDEMSRLAQADTPKELKEPTEGEPSLLKWNELRSEYDRVLLKAEDLQRQLEKAQQDLAGGKKALSDVHARLTALEKE